MPSRPQLCPGTGRRPSPADVNRRPRLHVLSVHCASIAVDRCVDELNESGLAIHAEKIGTPEELVEQIHSRSVDLIIAEYPTTRWKGLQVQDVLRRINRRVPLILVADGITREEAALS